MLGALDLAVLRAFRTRGHTPARERAVAAFSHLGEQAMVWYALSAAGALLDPERRPVYVKAAKTIAAVYVLNQAIKFTARRPRPKLDGLPPLTGTLSGLSYPSAHAATSFAAARMLSPAIPPSALYSTATALSLSRLYLGVHHPSDIVAGAVLGAAVAELAS
ncbi:MAG TPA: phosphatase PAP2 family protein [Thermoleophilaceae bacterium]|nr:phosphatase PAP2 family protein [Thermoleophilaceae bacterium]